MKHIKDKLNRAKTSSKNIIKLYLLFSILLYIFDVFQFYKIAILYFTYLSYLISNICVSQFLNRLKQKIPKRLETYYQTCLKEKYLILA